MSCSLIHRVSPPAAMISMTENIQYFFVFLLLWLFSSLFLHYISKNSTKQTTHLCLPPSPPAFPFIGHIHHLTRVAHECFHNLSSKYGPLLSVRLGSYHFVVVSSASMAADIYRTHDVNFSSKPKSVLGDGLLFGNSSFFYAPYGQYWRFMKKLCVSELLGVRQLERSRNLRREELLKFLQKMMEKAHKNEVVDVRGEIMTLTNNSTCKMVMSTRCSGDDNQAEKCRVLVNESFELAVKMTLTYFLGPLRKLGTRVLRKQASELQKRFDELMEKLLKEHEERAKRDGGEREDKDLMDILLEVYQDKDAEVKITRTQMKSFFLDLFVAGTSTTADSMLWIMAELINHPNAFNKLRKEIETVVGRNRLVKESDIPNLYYLQAVAKEALRLYPPAPIMPRVSRENCKIRGFDIPKDTPVVINAYSIMRDPELWDNPNDFCPDRFLISTKESNRTRKDFAFVPFGGGRRMCPGSTLAFSLINTTIASMVQCFDWKVAGVDNGAKANMRLKSGATMTMAHPLLCRPAVHFNPFAA